MDSAAAITNITYPGITHWHTLTYTVTTLTTEIHTLILPLSEKVATNLLSR